MIEDDVGPRTLRFTVPPDAVAVYRSWRMTADLAYLEGQLQRRGWAEVVRLGTEEGLIRITELPSPGEADPRYGDFGGGFDFCFQPGRGSCRLTVTAPPMTIPLFPPDEAAHSPVVDSLDLDIEPMDLLDTIIKTPGNYGILDDCPNDPAQPWRFAITGPRIKRLAGLGWDYAVPTAYTYTFVPTNVGCAVHVVNLHSGVLMDLTEEDFW